MNFIPEEREENNPYLQLLMLLCYAIVGIIAGTLLSVVILLALYGTAGFGNLSAFAGGNAQYINVLKISQVLTTGFLFILPPLWLARSENIKTADFYGFRKPRALWTLLVVLIMVCSMPLMEWVMLANQKMALPGFLKWLEDWMRSKEDEMMKMTILLLKIDHAWDFIINLFIIALLPAVAEEFFFRGAVQRSFNRLFKNPHVAIWVTAFIFSAIHLQFFGFFPRMLLGAAFGYIYWWTGSLWYAMLAHFLNNAYAVCQAWYLQVHHIPLESADNSAYFKWYGYLISVILTIFLFRFLQHKTIQSNGKQLG